MGIGSRSSKPIPIGGRSTKNLHTNGSLTTKRRSRRVGVGDKCASVAQSVEQLTLNQLVVGSSPSRGTSFTKKKAAWV